AGKSTLLKIMTNEFNNDSGEIFKAKDINIGYLEQHITINENKTVWQFMLDVFSDFIQEEKALNELAEKIEFNANNQIDDADVIQSYSAHLQKFEESGCLHFDIE